MLFLATKICLCAYEICACVNTHTGVYNQHIFYQSSRRVSLGELRVCMAKTFFLERNHYWAGRGGVDHTRGRKG